MLIAVNLSAFAPPAAIAAALVLALIALPLRRRLRYPPGCEVEFRRGRSSSTGQVRGFDGRYVRVVNVSTGTEHRIPAAKLKRR